MDKIFLKATGQTYIGYRFSSVAISAVLAVISADAATTEAEDSLGLNIFQRIALVCVICSEYERSSVTELALC